MKRPLPVLWLAISLLCGAFVRLDASPDRTDYERQCAEIASAKPQRSEHDRLWALFDIDWKYTMTQYPEWATEVGYPGQNDRWTDYSFAAIDLRKRELEAPVAAIRAIDRSKLSEDDRVNYEIFRYSAEEALDGRRFKDELMPISQMDGPQKEVARRLLSNPARSTHDFDDILSRLRTLPILVDQTIALLQEGLKEGITPAQIAVRDVPHQLESYTESDPGKNPLMQAVDRFPQDMDAADHRRIRAEEIRLITQVDAPAFARLREYFINEYLPHCRKAVGWSALPDGDEWYRFEIRHHTTTRLSPKQIHRLGLSEVRRIRKEMDRTVLQAGYKDLSSFKQFLQNDPRFFYQDPEQLLIGYRDIAKRIDPELPKLFGKLPRLPYGVLAVPTYAEKSEPAAYYDPGSLNAGRAGFFRANTYDLKSRPKWLMEDLTLHEAVPGHHLQISLAEEMNNLPEFRKHGFFNAYSEGWGLYAESLGYELGLYKDPYSRFGQLSDEMWRAVRLVIDTGMHSFGWSRQQAIDFFRENTGASDHDIEVEVDRYLVMPGQALSYKIGELKIQELKRLARKELGPRFDIRAFHDAMLALGSVPLEVLDAQMKEWIAKASRRTPQTSNR